MNSNYCKVKGTILKAVLSGNDTAKIIMQAVNYQHSIDSLYRELNFLRAYGYLKRKRTGRVSHYSLTAKGREHTDNPFIYVNYKKRRLSNIVKDEVEDTLKDNEKFKKAVEDFAKKHYSEPIIVLPRSKEIVPVESDTKTRYVSVPGEANKETTLSASYPQSVSPRGCVSSPGCVTSDNERELVLRERISELERELQYLRTKPPEIKYIPQPSKAIDVRTGKVLSPEQAAILREQHIHKHYKATSVANHRRNMAGNYRGYYLDLGFFKSWGNAIPVKLKRMPFWRPGAVEIVSRNNAEWSRNHISRELTVDEVFQAQFLIVRFGRDSISVMGRGMKEPKVLKY